MPKTFLQDEKAIFEQIFYTDRARTTAVDPLTISFHIKKPDGSTDSATPASNGGTGYWKVEYLLDQYGTWEWRWSTENPRIISQGEIWVTQRNVENVDDVGPPTIEWEDL